MKTSIIVVPFLLLFMLSAQADEYLYDTLWNRQIEGRNQMLSPDRQKAYSISKVYNGKLYSLDIKSGQVDTLVKYRTTYFSPNLETYIGINLEVANSKTTAYRVSDNSIIKEFDFISLNSTYSSNGEYFISITSDASHTDNYITVFDTKNFSIIFVDNFKEEAQFSAIDISFSPNGKKFLLKATFPNRPDIITKYHIYELDNLKKYEYLGDYGKGYLRDDDVFFASYHLIDYKQNQIIENIPINYSIGERYVMCQVENENIYFISSTEDLKSYFLDKYNFELKKSVRYSFTKNINVTKIVTLYNDTILGTGRNTETNIGGWFFLNPKIIAGVANTNNDIIDLFPNPTNSMFTISNLPNNVQFILKLSNSNGQVLKNDSRYSINSTIEINISDLPKGIYFINLQSNDFNKSFKFIKE